MFDIDLDAATSLSVSLLILGFGLTVFPPVIIKMNEQERSHDFKVTILLILLFAIMIAASQAIWLARSYPDILYPLVGVTLGFRIISPGIFVYTLKEKSENQNRWRSFRGILILVSLALIFYTFVSGMTNKTNNDLAISERFLMTMAVAYTYARAYLKLFQQFFFDWEERYILFSGLLIGISFVILIPFLVTEFDRVYKLTGTIGWFGAFLCLYKDRSIIEALRK